MAKSVENMEQLQPESSPAEATPYREGPKAERRQYYAAAAAHLGSFIMATVWSWSSTALPSLRLDHESLGEITLFQEAWIASITFLAGAVGAYATGYIAQKLGLKMSLVIATVPLLIGWLMITFAQSMTVILTGRFLTGFWVAGVGVSGSLIAEISNVNRRGRLNFGFDLLFCTGVLYIYIIGTFFNWRIQAAACSVICVIFFVLLLTIYESPRCLIQQGKETQAKKALKWIRDHEDVNSEFTDLQLSVQAERQNSRQHSNNSGWLKTLMSTYLSMPVIKPILLAIALQFFLQVCGVVPIVCYAVDVFKAAGTEGVHENVSTIVLGAVNLIATIIATFFVDKSGRRPLMMWSEAFLVLTLMCLGTFLFFKNSLGYALNNWFWSFFPLACFVIFITAYSFGVGPLPWVIQGEIFHPSAKGFSNGVVILAARVFGFLVMFFFKDMNEIIGQHGVYWFFAGVCLTGLIFSYLFIPETKDRTLDQVQEDLQRGWFHNRTNTVNETANQA